MRKPQESKRGAPLFVFLMVLTRVSAVKTVASAWLSRPPPTSRDEEDRKIVLPINASTTRFWSPPRTGMVCRQDSCSASQHWPPPSQYWPTASLRWPSGRRHSALEPVMVHSAAGLDRDEPAWLAIVPDSLLAVRVLHRRVVRGCDSMAGTWHGGPSTGYGCKRRDQQQPVHLHTSEQADEFFNKKEETDFGFFETTPPDTENNYENQKSNCGKQDQTHLA